MAVTYKEYEIHRSLDRIDGDYRIYIVVSTSGDTELDDHMRWIEYTGILRTESGAGKSLPLPTPCTLVRGGIPSFFEAVQTARALSGLANGPY